MEIRRRKTPWADVRCEARSVSALVQQLSVQLVPRGYWYYVTGSIPLHLDVRAVDRNIIERYDVDEDPSGRLFAERKRRSEANVKYLRLGRFYVLIATKGAHLFKRRERARVRCLKRDRRRAGHSRRTTDDPADNSFPYAPLLIPLESTARIKRRKGSNSAVGHRQLFEGYAISYRRASYVRKTAKERAEYQKLLADWKSNTRLGKRIPKPSRGKREVRWRTHTEIEERSLHQLESQLLVHATDWSEPRLAAAFQSTPYEPYWAVRSQLRRILKAVNQRRSTQGLRQLPLKTVDGMKREQLHVFVERGEGEPEAA